MATSLTEIERSIRTLICLSQGDESDVLLEGRLAEDFGVSRTPVRQVLQRLAVDGAVLIKPGVGTVPSPLDDADRDVAFRVLRELARAAAAVAGPQPVPDQVRAALGGLPSVLEVRRGETDPAAFVSIAAMAIEAIGAIVDDPVMSRAMTAAAWRVVGYRVREFRADPARFWSGLEHRIEELSRDIATDAVDDLLLKLGAPGND